MSVLGRARTKFHRIGVFHQMLVDLFILPFYRSLKKNHKTNSVWFLYDLRHNPLRTHGSCTDCSKPYDKLVFVWRPLGVGGQGWAHQFPHQFLWAPGTAPSQKPYENIWFLHGLCQPEYIPGCTGLGCSQGLRLNRVRLALWTLVYLVPRLSFTER